MSASALTLAHDLKTLRFRPPLASAIVLTSTDQEIFDFAVKRTKAPGDEASEDIKSRCKADFVDLIVRTALFGWANRLMHAAGDPVPPVDQHG